MATRNLDVFFRRWEALDDLIQAAIVTYGPPAVFDRQNTILSLLQKLRDFAAGQFQFFYYGFEPPERQRQPDDPRLQTWDQYPPEDILTGIIDQIGHDFALIQRAADQRRTINQPVLDTLAMADKLAWLALQPAIRNRIVVETTTALTYFEKSAEFYTLPYADVALISVPYTCTMPGIPQDFLAIPHEVGHYVYRHLTPDAVAMLRGIVAAPTVPPIYRDWVTNVFEEMCADIYGCLIGGPIMAMDFQMLALANSEATFSEGDNKHPNAALRPLIYCQVLANINVRRLTVDDWNPIAQKLADQWMNELRQQHVDFFVVTPNRNQGQNQNFGPQRQRIADLKPLPGPGFPPDYGALGNVIQRVVDRLIETILAFINRNGRVQDPNDLTGWAGAIGAATLPGQLFAGFGAWFNARRLENIPVNDIQPAAGAPLPRNPNDHSSELWLRLVQPRNSTINLGRANPQILSGEVEDTTRMEPGTWGYILNAKGWTTEGPSDTYKHPLT